MDSSLLVGHYHPYVVAPHQYRLASEMMPKMTEGELNGP